ncbi:hypothetical protein PI124_g20873 [Phytophthora idaei]|nr:hypothetical protein PI125_g12137 [Phytophthora idaei]KAG3130503.1 hypothetical protein PI126_g20469 [Phytophthora idaei]KAG3234071.1 hypothetical protein PI124_g20873 [Phytophthora idaei]
MEELKANNPATKSLKCVIIEKAFTEMSVLETAFPNVRILLYQFYVIKYLRAEVAKTDEYGFNPWQKQQLRGLINLMVYAKSEREYQNHRRYMQHVIAVGSQPADPVEQGTDPIGQRSSAEVNDND